MEGLQIEPIEMDDGTSDERKPDPPGIHRLELADSEAFDWKCIAEKLLAELSGEPTEEELSLISVVAHDLPAGIRQELNNFRLGIPGAPRGGMVVSGLPLADEALGATPEAFQEKPRTREAQTADAALLLLASLLGDPFSHAAVQKGSLILDICPIAGNEHTQLASSSEGGLAWHNEDAYHEYRADWLLLMCMRNPQGAGTTFARVDDIVLDAQTRKALSEPIFEIRPDESHLSGSQTPGVRQMAVLSGFEDAPFLCIDPEFMHEQSVEGASETLKQVTDELERCLRPVILEPGDVLVVDNRRAVHGRDSFTARYDGTDRWLRVVNVTADLRRSTTERLRLEDGGPEHGRALRTQGIAGGD